MDTPIQPMPPKVEESEPAFLESGSETKPTGDAVPKSLPGLEASPQRKHELVAADLSPEHLVIPRAALSGCDTACSTSDSSNPPTLQARESDIPSFSDLFAVSPVQSGSFNPGQQAFATMRKKKPEQHESVEFHEVFQDGHAPTKHIIVRSPVDGASWYIFRCRQHGLNFNTTNPIRGAAKHLSSAGHGNLRKDYALAVLHFGVEVRNCSALLAEKNNAIAREAFRTTDFKVRKHSKTRRDWLGRVLAESSAHHGTLAYTSGTDTVELPPPGVLALADHPARSYKDSKYHPANRYTLPSLRDVERHVVESWRQTGHEAQEPPVNSSFGAHHRFRSLPAENGKRRVARVSSKDWFLAPLTGPCEARPFRRE